MSKYQANKDHEIAGAAIGAAAGAVLGLLAGATYAYLALSPDEKTAWTNWYNAHPNQTPSKTSTDPTEAAAAQAFENHMTGAELMLGAGVLGMGYLGYRIGK